VAKMGKLGNKEAVKKSIAGRIIMEEKKAVYIKIQLTSKSKLVFD
jgi:hypothetical protein